MMRISTKVALPLLAGLMAGVGGCASAPSADDSSGADKAAAIQAAIANPNRREADRERDARDQPAVTLALLDIGPGDDAVLPLGRAPQAEG